MVPLNTATVGLAVTPAVISTFISHFLDRKSRRLRPTAHLTYDEGLHLIRSFLDFASHHTVEELQAFTSQWVPHPQWVKVDDIPIAKDSQIRAAEILEAQLGTEGVRRVGGSKWWRRSELDPPQAAEWVEMRADYHERKARNDPGKRVMFYIHGGAYFFGSVDEHRYQLQRHARKLKARVFAPRYRLAPQDPFPCGLQDCLAAYLHLLTLQEPNTIVLAGDSAGGGMVLSILVMLRDQGIPLPAGAVLISPWADLTHSFPSVAGDGKLDYIPPGGFHYRPSMAWPPPNEKELEEMKELALQERQRKATNRDARAKEPTSTIVDNPTVTDIASKDVTMKIEIDGKTVEIEEQIQLYTTNDLLSHPLVSPVMQPTLGGLPPLLVMVGGGELLRDEQIYIAHKCANPKKYLPADSLLDEKARAQIEKYKPTDVQLQVWEDLCHVAPTLSFTRPAKYMYRSVAQFGAWALARAQNTEIEIMDDDQVSIISTSTDSSGDEGDKLKKKKSDANGRSEVNGQVGIAGDPLPPFVSHMIRQRVTRHGDVFPLEPASELPGCTMDRNLVGVIKQGTVRKWLAQTREWDIRFSSTKKQVRKDTIRAIAKAVNEFDDGEFPPPSAVASRRKSGRKAAEKQHKKKKRSMGLAMWSGWGSKHDEQTVKREQALDGSAETTAVTQGGGLNARPFLDIQNQETTAAISPQRPRPRSRRRTVTDERQTEIHGEDIDENTPMAEIEAAKHGEVVNERPLSSTTTSTAGKTSYLSPDYHPKSDIGTSGKRPYVDGIAVPFSLGKDAETASMVTLMSGADQVTPMAQNEFFAPLHRSVTGASARTNGTVTEPHPKATDYHELETPAAERPGMETFVTAAEALPTLGSVTKEATGS